MARDLVLQLRLEADGKGFRGEVRATENNVWGAVGGSCRCAGSIARSATDGAAARAGMTRRQILRRIKRIEREIRELKCAMERNDDLRHRLQRANDALSTLELRAEAGALTSMRGFLRSRRGWRGCGTGRGHDLAKEHGAGGGCRCRSGVGAAAVDVAAARGGERRVRRGATGRGSVALEGVASAEDGQPKAACPEDKPE